MTESPDLSALAQRLERLETRAPVADQVQQVVEAAADVLPVAGAGLALLDDANTLKVVAATDEAIDALLAAQCELGSGAAVDAVVHQQPTTAVGGDEPAQLLAVPVKVGPVSIGSLVVARPPQGDWLGSDFAALDAFATLVEGIVANAITARRQDAVVAQLHYALDHRVVIERAVGFVMATRHVDAVGAFNLLRDAARSQRKKVADLAAAVLSGGTDAL